MKFNYRILFIAGLFFANICLAQTPHQIKIIDGTGVQIPGELVGPGQNGNIAFTSVGQENVNCTDILGGSCTSKPGNFIFNTTEISPINALKKALFTTEHLTSVEINFWKNGGSQYVYYKIRMENVLVKHVTDGYNSTGAFSHQVELQGGRIGWTLYSSSGTVINKFGWDYIQNVQWNNF